MGNYNGGAIRTIAPPYFSRIIRFYEKRSELSCSDPFFLFRGDRLSEKRKVFSDRFSSPDVKDFDDFNGFAAGFSFGFLVKFFIDFIKRKKL